MITSSSSVCGMVTSDISDFGLVVFVFGWEGLDSSLAFFSSGLGSSLGSSDLVLVSLVFGLTSSFLGSSSFFSSSFLDFGLVTFSSSDLRPSSFGSLRDFFLSSLTDFLFSGLSFSTSSSTLGLVCVGSVSILSDFGFSLDGLSCVISWTESCVSSGVLSPLVTGTRSFSWSSSFRRNFYYKICLYFLYFYFKFVSQKI